MNERIRQLAEQATTYEWMPGRGSMVIFDQEKFAQLIVRECIDTAFHRGHPDLEFLLKHFGVEE
jgi:hypothetical protein